VREARYRHGDGESSQLLGQGKSQIRGMSGYGMARFARQHNQRCRTANNSRKARRRIRIGILGVAAEPFL
jgi:hypothetical protein